MNELHRYFIELAYNGTNYHGWQLQPNALTVQQLVNSALSTLFRQTIETTGCGRTDTGVHASSFYAHFELEQNTNFNIPGPGLLRGLNALLPYDISAKRFIPVAPEAHARFDATLRSYQYHIHFKKDPFKHDRSWLLRDQPDIRLMNQAAGFLLQYHDFSCFSKSNTQVSTNNCTVSRAKWISHRDGLVFHISSDRFLRNMVRAIVGTLVSVGKAEMPPEALHGIIRSKDRSNAGTSVPACGLYLTEVVYPYLQEPFTED